MEEVEALVGVQPCMMGVAAYRLGCGVVGKGTGGLLKPCL
jgi:hypothetical protein